MRWADQAEKSDGGFSIGGTAALQVRGLQMQIDQPYHWKRFIKYSLALAVLSIAASHWRTLDVDGSC